MMTDTGHGEYEITLLLYHDAANPRSRPHD